MNVRSEHSVDTKMNKDQCALSAEAFGFSFRKLKLRKGGEVVFAENPIETL